MIPKGLGGVRAGTGLRDPDTTKKECRSNEWLGRATKVNIHISPAAIEAAVSPAATEAAVSPTATEAAVEISAQRPRSAQSIFVRVRSEACSQRAERSRGAKGGARV
eukprot:gene13165-biopygen1833